VAPERKRDGRWQCSLSAWLSLRQKSARTVEKIKEMERKGKYSKGKGRKGREREGQGRKGKGRHKCSYGISSS
jgi:hypothetical protein